MKRLLAKGKTFLREMGVLPIRLYQKYISPAKPPSCRYYPSCSEYALQAVRRYGLFGGGLMAAARLLRCHPWAKGGYDPLPAHYTLRSFAGVTDPAPEPDPNNDTEE